MRSYGNTPRLTDPLVELQPILDSYPYPAVYVGGLPTDLLLADHSSIVHEDKAIDIDDCVDVPLYRSNGTLRDIDIVCFTDNKDSIADLRNELQGQLVNDHNGLQGVKVSVSGYESSVRESSYLQLVSQVSKKDSVVDLSIGPIAESIAESAFEEQWTLNYQSMRLPVHHPIAHMYNYRVRSLAGLRPKDRDKVMCLEDYLRDIFSDEEWSRFAPYDRLEARITHELGLLEIFRSRNLQKFSMGIARIALQCFEASPVLTKHAQQESGPLHTLASMAVRLSRGSFSG